MKKYSDNRARAFAKQLNKFMHSKDMRQIDLAKLLGVHKSVVSAWCNGTRSPRPETLEKLSVIFGMPEDCFYTEADEDTIDPMGVQFAQFVARGMKEEVDFLAAYNLLREVERKNIRDITIGLSKKGLD